MTDRSTNSRVTGKRRRDKPPPGQTMRHGALVVAVLVVIAVLGLRLYNGVPGRDYGTVFVSTPVMGNLLSHDQVRIGGVRVGQVLKREVGQDGQPRIELQLDPAVKLPIDTGFAIRASGLLGARFVELIPGRSPQELAHGATIRGNQSSYSFGLPEALDVFNGKSREGLRSTVDNLGAGLFGNGRGLNRTIGTLGSRTRQFDQVARAILGRDGAAARLLPALHAAVVPLYRNRGLAADFNRAAADALNPFVTERAATRAALDQASPALGAVDSGLAKGRRLLESVRAFTGEANRTLPDAPQGLTQLSALLAEGRQPLRRAAPLLRAVQPAVPGALRITRALRPVLPDVTQLVDHGTPVLGAIAARGCDVITFGTMMRSMTGFGQPGSGPGGPAMAFRLQAVSPMTSDVVGVKDPGGLLERDAASPPCRYQSKEFAQFVPLSARPGRLP